MCCMEIPRQARKCPYCQHFQTRASLILFHPAWAAIIACVLPLVMWIFFATLLSSGEDYEEYRDQIIITESQAVFGEAKGGGTAGVVGIIRNNSPVPWKDIRFHVEFFDSNRRRVDVAQKE